VIINGSNDEPQKQSSGKNGMPLSDDTTVTEPTSNAKSASGSLIADDTSSKHVNIDDGSTQISSDDSAKPLSFDTKSVASATTFAMDEKESLRPDDSASMRAVAVEDDELISAPGSVIAGSRVGSDLGAKAFREQLHEIANINSVKTVETVSSHFSVPVVVNSTRLPPALPGTSHQVAAVPITTLPHDMQSSITLPDEKLLDALQSPRDRVFVLKIEQDVIDFIGSSKFVQLKTNCLEYVY
jgi:hypothetical protein